MNPWNPTITFLIQSNYDINFILSSIKALALIPYIINYTTKSNCGQYQRVMVTAILRKAFNDYDKDSINSPANYTLSFDKITLKTFN